MSDHATNMDRLFDLAGMVCDDIASPEEFIELDSIVRADRTAREWYLCYCRTHISLRLELRAKLATQAIYQQIGIEPPAAGSSELQIPGEDTRPVLSAPTFPATSFNSSLTYLSSGWPVAYLIATVIFGIGAIIGSYTYVTHPEHIAINRRVGPAEYSPTRPGSIARITGMADCGQWPVASGQRVLAVGSRISLGEKLELASGLLEITYDTGARVILQGPVTYEVDSDKSGYLSIGKLTARLEQREGGKGKLVGTKGHGSPDSESPPPISSSTSDKQQSLFAVKTPTAIVTDLGTEFGVEVASNGRTTSYVFQGTVKVSAVGTDGTPSQEVVLSKNESACVENEGKSEKRRTVVRQTKVDPSGFTLELPRPQTTREASDSYAKLVLSMNPAVYYRMEPPKDGDPKVLYDSAPGKHHGTIHFADGYVATTPYVKGRFGNALLLRGPVLKDYAIVDDYPKAADGQLTVSAWALAMGRDRSSVIAGNWLQRKTRLNGGQFVMYMSVFSNYRLAGRGSEQDGRQVTAIEGNSAFRFAEWQHVVLVFNGTTMHLYRNGVEMASVPCQGVYRDTPVKRLAIGYEERNWLTEKMGFWRGRIDEFSLFNRALSADEIQRLYHGH